MAACGCTKLPLQSQGSGRACMSLLAGTYCGTARIRMKLLVGIGKNGIPFLPQGSWTVVLALCCSFVLKQSVERAMHARRIFPSLMLLFPALQDRLYATLANKELTKKMSPTNAKALNTMRQRLRKHNPAYAEQMEKFRANPESEEEPDR